MSAAGLTDAGERADAAERVVAVDLACTGCGYNLRTLKLSGTCPECGRPVAQALSGYYLHSAPTESVRALGHHAESLATSLGIGWRVWQCW
jgi:predicted amidophosphoribosyltransferase